MFWIALLRLIHHSGFEFCSFARSALPALQPAVTARVSQGPCTRAAGCCPSPALQGAGRVCPERGSELPGQHADVPKAGKPRSPSPFSSHSRSGARDRGVVTAWRSRQRLRPPRKPTRQRSRAGVPRGGWRSGGPAGGELASHTGGLEEPEVNVLHVDAQPVTPARLPASSSCVPICKRRQAFSCPLRGPLLHKAGCCSRPGPNSCAGSHRPLHSWHVLLCLCLLAWPRSSRAPVFLHQRSFDLWPQQLSQMPGPASWSPSFHLLLSHLPRLPQRAPPPGRPRGLRFLSPKESLTASVLERVEGPRAWEWVGGFSLVPGVAGGPHCPRLCWLRAKLDRVEMLPDIRAKGPGRARPSALLRRLAESGRVGERGGSTHGSLGTPPASRSAVSVPLPWAWGVVWKRAGRGPRGSSTLQSPGQWSPGEPPPTSVSHVPCCDRGRPRGTAPFGSLPGQGLRGRLPFDVRGC